MATKLIINPVTTTNGVLDFDGSTYVILNGAPSADIEFAKKLTFKLWLDASGGYPSYDNIFHSWSSGSTYDMLNVRIDGSLFHVSGFSASGPGYKYEIGNYYNQILECEVNKTYRTIESFKINGVTQTPVGASPPLSPTSGSWMVGNNNGNILDNATAWDFKLYDTSAGGELIHYWKGYPNGDTSTAWNDLVGDMNNVIVTNIGDGATTRSIEGAGQNVFEMFNKLLILGGTPVVPSFFSFITDSSFSDYYPPFLRSHFDPEVSVNSGGVLEWDLGDGSIVNTNEVYHDYYQQGNKTVNVYLGTVSSVTDINKILMDDDGIVGTLDLEDFTGLTDMRAVGNPKFTEVLLPTTSNLITNLAFWNNDLTCDMDLQSKVPNISGILNLQRNPSLGQITLPYSNSNTFTVFNFWESNIIGTFDCSGMTGLTTSFVTDDNPELDQILFPDISTWFSQFSIRDCSLSGVLDVSSYHIYGSFNCSANAGITTILFKDSSENWTYFNASQCDLTGSLDLTGFPNIGGTIYLYSNENLTEVIFPDNSVNISAFNINGTGISVLDVSGLTGFGGSFTAGVCNDLTTILWPPESNTISSIYLSNNPKLLGPIDISALTISGSFRMDNCPSVNELYLPSTFADEFSLFDVNGDGLSVSSVDDIFDKFNTYYSSNTPTQALTIDTAGGTNAAPTDGSSNSDILNLESIFSGAGKTLNITINIAAAPAMLEFTTNSTTFDPAFVTSAGTLNWDLGDASDNVNANSFTHTYGSPGSYAVKVEPGTASGPEAITEINMINDNIIGTLDLSALTNLGGYFAVAGGFNAFLTELILPTSSQVFTDFRIAYNTGLAGVLDVSGLTGLGGYFFADSCSTLSSILFPDSSQAFTRLDISNCSGITGTLDMSGLSTFTERLYASSCFGLTGLILPESSIVITDMYLDQCDITGVLDCSGLTSLGGNFIVSYNYNMTNILVPDSSQQFIEFNAIECGLTGTLDVSGLINFGDETGSGAIFDVNTNPNLTQIILPTNSPYPVQRFSAYDCSLAGTLDLSGLTKLYAEIDVAGNNNLLAITLPSSWNDDVGAFYAPDCSLNQSTVNNIFSTLDTYFSSNTPTTALTVTVDGGGTASPTDGSSNTNILSLISIFSGAGQTFTYNIN